MSDIADAQEVLRVITGIMRAEAEIPVAERRRAAELLAKRYGLLQPDQAGRSEARLLAARAIEAALEAMREEVSGPSGTGTSSGG